MHSENQHARIAAVVDLALKAGARHRESLMALREALVAGVSPDKIVDLAREACGLEQADCHAPRKARR